MKLWLISQDENNGYDTFDSAVVATETELDARQTHPSKGHPKPWQKWGSSPYEDWASSPDKITAKYLGEAAEGIIGVVCASFNAG